MLEPIAGADLVRPAAVLPLLDFAGVAVFAATGALAAAREKHDVLTFAFFAAVTGMGGGTLRDLLIGAPVFWVQDWRYVAVCMVAAVGFWIGILFLLALDHLIPHLHLHAEQAEGPHSRFSKTVMMALAVTLHNIPEGMAVGVVLAGWLAGGGDISFSAALALSVGIAIQNFPEGAIVSMPLRASGASRARAFVLGMLSGAVEPVGGALTILAASFVVPVLPYLLAFAAGAMLYVVVEELIPEMSEGTHSDVGVVCFAVGFTLMMALDVALG